MKSSIWEAIDDQLLPTEIDDQAKECFFEFIRKNQSKGLLVLDGLDEMNSSELKSTFDLVDGKELSGCHVVLTSRHEVGKKLRGYCDTLWKIIEFTRRETVTFIRKYFKKSTKSTLPRN